MSSTQVERLSAYRAKRSGDRTPEPFAGQGSAGARRFVVQHHAARRIHYDLRLEWNGVLWSWAVPKGPSPNPSDKRLAVHVEDHPVDYADFEGVIPQGNYGAGASIVWDRGTWEPLTDPDEGLDKGKLLFELKGYKLRGKWTLVRTKQDWLFIKERDAYVSEAGIEGFPADSILSGLTVCELTERHRKSDRLRRSLKREKAPKGELTAKQVKLMLAVSEKEAFSGPDWLFEIKYDGYRLVVARKEGETLLRSRAGYDLTAVFPDIEQAVSALPFEDLVMDGEVVVHDADGLPSFSRLSRRGKAHSARGYSAGLPRAAGLALPVRPARVRGLRPQKARARDAQAAAAGAAAVDRAAAILRSRARARRSAVRGGMPDAPRGNRRQTSRLLLRERPLSALDQDHRGSHR